MVQGMAPHVAATPPIRVLIRELELSGSLELPKPFQSDLPDLLRDVPFRSDGSVQVVASKFLSGKPIGPYDFQGTRSDDPNDIFPHQDRRELRALQIFAAWMNHNDSA